MIEFTDGIGRKISPPLQTTNGDAENWLNAYIMAQNLKVKKARGGRREGAGRKTLFGEKTKLVKFSIPLSKVVAVSKLVKSFLQSNDKEGQGGLAD